MSLNTRLKALEDSLFKNHKKQIVTVFFDEVADLMKIKTKNFHGSIQEGELYIKEFLTDCIIVKHQIPRPPEGLKGDNHEPI